MRARCGKYSDLPEAVHDSNAPFSSERQSGFEGLQVTQPEKVVYAEHTPLESRADISEEKVVYAGHTPLEAEEEPWRSGEGAGAGERQERRNRRRICGCMAWRFWTMLGTIVGLLIIGAAVGGGVGAKLAEWHETKVVDQSQAGSAGNTSTSSAVAPVSSSPSTPTADASSLSASTTSASPSLTTSAIANTGTSGPSTLYRDCPSSNQTLYTTGSSAEPMLFRKYCEAAFTSPGQAASDSTLLVNVAVDSLDACIDQCGAYNIQNLTSIQMNQSPICNSVCWRNGSPPDDHPGQCFAWMTVNTTSGFSFKPGDQRNCDSAAMINQQVFTQQ